MPYVNQLTTRWDGTEFVSRRSPKLHIRKADGALHACTGVAHAAVVLSTMCGGDPITAGAVTRRSRGLRKRLLACNVAILWQAEMWPTTVEETPFAVAQSSPLRSAVLDGS